MGNKLKNLLLIKKKILKKRNFEIPRFIFFKKKQYINKKAQIIKIISLKFKSKVIIRSSSLNEDLKSLSNAGKYDSVISNQYNIEKNINFVIKKLKLSDFFIVQELIENVNLSAVLFTRDLSDNSPYININIDRSKKTNLITSGKRNPTMDSYIIHRSFKYIPKKFKNIILMVNQLEALFKTDRLDIEFAQKNKKIYLFQCRSLVKKKIQPNLNSELLNIEKKIKNIKVSFLKILIILMLLYYLNYNYDFKI